MNSKSHLNKNLFNSVYLFLFQCFVVLLFSSCVSQKEVEYLQENAEQIQIYDEAFINDYKLKPKDELYIQISSLDDPSANIFSSSRDQQFTNSGNIQPYGASLISYTIDKEGLILLPVIGIISVKDKTIQQVSEIITNSLANILNQPMVSVKLVNRYVTVLGEIQRPGQYVYTQDKITIYDALGLAGDIMDYGNRNEVIIIRNEDGKNKRILVDLTQSDLLASNFLYLRPNDIVYVKPLKKKFWGMRQFPFAIILSTITAGILLYEVVK